MVLSKSSTVEGKGCLPLLLPRLSDLGMGQNKTTRNWTAGLSLWFHLPGQPPKKEGFSFLPGPKSPLFLRCPKVNSPAPTSFLLLARTKNPRKKDGEVFPAAPSAGAELRKHSGAQLRSPGAEAQRRNVVDLEVPKGEPELFLFVVLFLPPVYIYIYIYIYV